MAKHCTTCGHELRDSDKFCAECGTPARDEGTQQAAPIEWEYCEITFSVKEGRFLASNTGTFYARAVGPTGTYEAARSTTIFYPGMELSFGGWRLNAEDKRVKAAHEEVVQALVSSGWEPTGRGEWWWELKFRRPVRR